MGGSLTVTAAPLTITANAQSRAYGAANPTLTYVVGGSSLLNGDTLTGLLATTAAATSNIGAYGISQGTLAASSNYALSYVDANLTVIAPRLLSGELVNATRLAVVPSRLAKLTPL